MSFISMSSAAKLPRSLSEILFFMPSDAIEFRVFAYNCFQSASNACMDAGRPNGRLLC